MIFLTSNGRRAEWGGPIFFISAGRALDLDLRTLSGWPGVFNTYFSLYFLRRTEKLTPSASLVHQEIPRTAQADPSAQM